MRRLLSEDQHREILDGLIEGIESAGVKKASVVHNLRPRIDALLDVLRESRRDNLLDEYRRRFGELGHPVGGSSEHLR